MRVKYEGRYDYRWHQPIDLRVRLDDGEYEAIQRATGKNPVEAIRDVADVAIAQLIAKGRRGLDADAMIARGELEVGRG